MVHSVQPASYLLVMISETHLLLDVHIYIRRIEPRKKILRVPFMVIIPMFRLQNLRKFVQPIFQRAMRSRDTRWSPTINGIFRLRLKLSSSTLRELFV